MGRLIGLSAACMSSLVFLQAQDATMIRVDYEAVTILADGTETLESTGVHYFTADGRYRRDETFAAGERTSLYRLPADGVNVSVNHDLQVAVPGKLGMPEWNARTSVRQIPPLAAFASPTTPLGERTQGLLVLQGFEGELPNGGRAEHWVYIPPLMMQDPLTHPPVPIEMIATMNTGERYELRVTSMRRTPIEADTFVVPDDVVAPYRQPSRRRPVQ